MKHKFIDNQIKEIGQKLNVSILFIYLFFNIFKDINSWFKCQ